MIEKLTTLDLRQRLGDLLNRVALRHDEFIIELRLLDPLVRKKTALSQEEADALADEAKHRSRKARGR